MKLRNLLLAPLMIVLVHFSYGQLPGLGGLKLGSGGPKFQANYLNPPSVVLDAEKIAILKFVDDNDNEWNYGKTTDGGSKVTDYIVSNLIKKNFGLGDEDKLYFKGLKTDIFTIVERSQLDKVLQEQKLGASGVLDDSKAAEIGKLLGLDVLVTGSVSYSDDIAQTEKRRKNYKTGKYYTEYKTTRTVTTEARIKFIDVETGQIVDTKEATSKSSDSKTSKSGYPSKSTLKSVQTLANNNYRDIGGRIARQIKPTYLYVGRPVKKIKAKEYKKQAKAAVDYLKDERIDRALLEYQKLYDADPFNDQIAYNVGVMFEGTGNFAKAQEAYTVAYESFPDDRDYEAAYKRIKKVNEYVETLKGMGVSIEPYSFSASGDAVADRVVTKGNAKKRYGVYEETDITSTLVGRVPGGREFIVMESNGDWFKIKLPGGKIGYIEASSVSKKLK